MAISPLTTPPDRRDPPQVFAERGNDFMAQLPNFAVEANALAVQVNADAAAAAASAVAAAASAGIAGPAATIASSAANYKGDYSAGTTYQVGQSVSYGGKRWSAKTVNTGVTPATGANWLELPGVASMPRLSRSSNTMLSASDSAALVDATGTFTQTFDTAANLMAGWYCYIRNSGTGAITLSVTTPVTIYPGETRLVQCDGTTIRAIPMEGRRAIVVRDEKASGTNGGTATTGGYSIRTLNTVASNTIDGASLSSNAITLPAGTYAVRASVPGVQCNLFKARLYNVTGAAVLLVGTAEYAYVSSLAAARSHIAGTFTLSVQSAVRLEMRAAYTGASSNELGAAAGFGDVEVYSEITIERID